MEYLQDINTYALTHGAPELLQYLVQLFPGQVKFSSSLGQEDQVLTEIIAKHRIGVEVFTLDTGRLFNESYELLDKTTARYKIPVGVYYPDAAAVEQFVRERGINGFYESVDSRKACCNVRKVHALNRALKGAKVWVTGIRAEQSDNRHDMPFVEWDAARELYKVNPLLYWTYDELLRYIEDHNIPYNTLHDKGFISIGCAPCTRAIEPGEDSRAGRWWWETSQKECGLHQVK